MKKIPEFSNQIGRVAGCIFLQYLLWMLFFALSRLIFFGFYAGQLRREGISSVEVAQAFYHALKLDLATASYFMVFPVFLIIIRLVLPYINISRINRIYTAVLVFAYALITAGETGLYAEWKTKLTMKALIYLKNPSEVYNSAETANVISLSVMIVLFTAVSVFVYRKAVEKKLRHIGKNYWIAGLLIITGFPLMVVGMRGGFQEIPINQSQVYFSHKHILNHAATNNAFNLFINFIENYKNLSSNPFTYYPTEEAEKTVDKIFQTKKDTTIRVLTHPNPNIVLLLMESWSADLIGSLGGEPGITPEFEKLENEGLLFDNVLSSGSRSEQGMASVFSGFPAHPITSITVQPDKHLHLPSFVHRLKGLGYHTSFYFGGQLIYGNIKSFIYYNDFDRIVEGKDFEDENIVRGKLGVHDEYTMDRVYRDLSDESEPFFSVLFTLSSHSPYDQPMEDVFTWGDNEKNYINSAFYSDRCLGEFVAKCKNTDWYDNTLFIIVADHSHNSYRNWDYPTAEYHKVPMLWLGGAFDSAYHGKRWHKPASQTDIPATILAQLNQRAVEYHWSKNLFNPYAPDFKYFGFDNGLVWIEPDGGFSYDADLDKYYWAYPDSIPAPELERRGKSFLQVLYQEYLDY